MVLLTNRVNPSAKNQKHHHLRWALHDLVGRGLAVAPHRAAGATQSDGCAADRLADALRNLPPVRWLH